MNVFAAVEAGVMKAVGAGDAMVKKGAADRKRAVKRPKAPSPKAPSPKAPSPKAGGARGRAKSAEAKKARAASTKVATERTGEIMPVVAFPTIDSWTAWLDAHRAAARGVWMKLAKKGSGEPSITYAEALEVALTYGWIDGQKGAHDDVWWLQKFTPRGAKSIWSAINRDKAIALIKAGKMLPSGLAEVERAKADGRWEAAYAPQSKSTVPPDLEAALAKSPRAKAFFATLDSRNRYAILFRTHGAKTAATRARRIAQFVAMLAKHEKIHA